MYWTDAVQRQYDGVINHTTSIFSHIDKYTDLKKDGLYNYKIRTIILLVHLVKVIR